MASRSELGTAPLDPKYSGKRFTDKPKGVQNTLALNDVATPTRTPTSEDGRTWVQDTPESIGSGTLKHCWNYYILEFVYHYQQG